jgi:hypothetical protein
MKNSFLLFISLAFVSGGFFVSVPNAEASCSYKGYEHSWGKCDKSGKGGGWKYHDEDDDEDYEDDDDDDRKKHGRFYSYTPRYNPQYDIVSLEKRIAELLILIERLKDVQGGGDAFLGDIRVSTQSASSINKDSAVLRALIDMNNENEGKLFFEYGTSFGNLSKDSDTVSLDEDDDGDVLEEEVSGLEDNSRYYFRAVVEDENGDKRYGATLSFVTDDNRSSNNDEPSLRTQSAQNIDSDSADLRGEVDMNDYENGKAFFVYGEDESQIEDVESDFDTYTAIDEDGDDLRKVEVDTDVDGTESYTKNVSGLSDNESYYYAMCVEYDDADKDETLVCGAVKSFKTD